MLRLRMELYPEVPLEVSGAPGVGQALCVREPLSTQRPQNTNKRDIKFHALLTEGGTRQLTFSASVPQLLGTETLI